MKRSKGQSSSYLLKAYGEPSNLKKTIDGEIWTYEEFTRKKTDPLSTLIVRSFSKKKKHQTTVFYLDSNSKIIEYNTTYNKVSVIKTGSIVVVALLAYGMTGLRN